MFLCSQVSQKPSILRQDIAVCNLVCGVVLLSAFRLLRAQRCLQVAPAATEDDHERAANDDRGEGLDVGMRTPATSDNVSEVDSMLWSYP